jgi:D-proline reductase (dithiol) PrdB
MTSNEETVRYMERTRDYYRAMGYTKDYVWSTFEDVPFARLAKPLREARIGLVTTAHPPDRSNRDAKGIRHVWSGPLDPLPVLNTDNLAWDRESTHTEDRESFMPIEAVQGWARDGLIGGLTPRFHGVPTEHSQRKTIEVDAPEILKRLREDGADAVLLSAL